MTKQKKRLFDRLVNVFIGGFLDMNSPFGADVSKASAYLWSFPEPKDDFDRSFYQYRCQSFLRKRFALWLLNMGCFFAIIPYIFICRFKKARTVESREALFCISIADKSIIPESLLKEYESIKITSECEGYALNSFDVKFIWRCFLKHPFAFYLLMHLVFKISIYRYFIEKYKPKAIVTNGEYACTSSILTYYCEQQGISHIDIMHGEKLFHIRDSFFRFTKCYVWDEGYIELLKSLRADKNDYVVEVPPSLLFKRTEETNGLPMVDYSYILFGNEKLEEIADTLHQLKSIGYSFKVRPHPTYTDINKVQHLFIEDEIEDCTVPISTSVLTSRNVISLYSTVLLQAYLSGVNVIIDDLHFPNEFNKLNDLKYMLISKNPKRLSNVIVKIAGRVV